MCGLRQPSIVGTLVKEGANVNEQDNLGNTPLVRALLSLNGTVGCGVFSVAFGVFSVGWGWGVGCGV